MRDDWKEAAQAPEQNVIYVAIDDFRAWSSGLMVNFDTSQMHSAFFLRLDDNFVKKGSWNKCGSRCTRHQFTLLSPVE